MKISVDASDVNIEYRINQFLKLKKTGNISLNGSREKFIRFRKGEPAECAFEGKTDYAEVAECFKALKKGKLQFEFIEDDMSEVPHLEDYVVLDFRNRYVSGNKELMPLYRKLSTAIDRDLFRKMHWKFELLFISYKNKNVGMFKLTGRVVFAVFSSRATLNIIRKKIRYLI